MNVMHFKKMGNNKLQEYQLKKKRLKFLSDAQ